MGVSSLYEYAYIDHQPSTYIMHTYIMHTLLWRTSVHLTIDCPKFVVNILSILAYLLTLKLFNTIYYMFMYMPLYTNVVCCKCLKITIVMYQDNGVKSIKIQVIYTLLGDIHVLKWKHWLRQWNSHSNMSCKSVIS